MDFYDLKLKGVYNHTTATDEDNANVNYKVTKGAFPEDLTGNGYYTAWDRDSADKDAARGQTVLGASFLSSPGRALRLDLGTGDAEHPIHGSLRTFKNAAHYLRSLAPEQFLRDVVAEVSIFGVSNPSNVAPLPFGKVGNGYRMLIGCDPAIPTEVSPKTLEVQGPVGFRHEWKAFLEGTLMPMSMTSGHPFFDPNDGPDGTLYMPDMLIRPPLRPTSRFGAYPQLRTWDGSGNIEGPWLLTDGDDLVFFQEASIHQVGTTRDYVLMAQTPISFGIATLLQPVILRLLAFLDPGTATQIWTWLTDNLPPATQLPSTRLLIISKKDIAQARVTGAKTIPCRQTEWEWETAHFFADYDNPNDTITLFAALAIGFDVTKSIQEGTELLDSRRADPELNTIFAAATDLQVCARFDIDAKNGGPPLSEKHVPSRDPNDPTFPLGVMMQIPTAPLYYRAPGTTPYDLMEVGRKWSHTFWCATGWMPCMESRAVFDLYRQMRVTDRLAEGKPPQRYIEEDAFLKQSRQETNNAVLYRLDREMSLDMKKDAFFWPKGWMAAAPFFAPREGAKSMEDGYLVCLVTPPTEDASMEIWIFDAGKPLADGPVCTLEPDREEAFRIGYPLHSTWMDDAAVEGWQDPAYKVPLVEPPALMKALDILYLGSSYVVSAARSRVVDVARVLDKWCGRFW